MRDEVGVDYSTVVVVVVVVMVWFGDLLRFRSLEVIPIHPHRHMINQ